jgi:tRNA pseudouridine32 synthase/23S rRNA pseudouridine746 synthase
MDEQLIFNFKTDISRISIPEKINNPFGSLVPKIAEIAAKEFQEYITENAQGWEHDFSVDNGKMFGVLVVQKKNMSYGFLRGVSGTLPGKGTSGSLVPSIFDDSADDYFIHKGMLALAEMTRRMKALTNESEITLLKKARKEKSFALQQQLFKHYRFLNNRGNEKNVVEIFEASSHGNPPSAAGDCAAPKLLQYAFEKGLKPIALAEFWWGLSPKGKERRHKEFYPSCKNKCRPILEYMLDDDGLFDQATSYSE